MTLYREIYNLKQILRRGLVLKQIPGRIESVAEHSFSAILLALEIMHINNLNLDQLKVIKMLAIHDIGEIDAGDITIHDNVSKEVKYAKEYNGISRISKQYNMPEIFDLWFEFEEGKTPEAKFVRLMDRFECCLSAEKIKADLNLPAAFDEFTNYYKKEWNECKNFKRSNLYNEVCKLKQLVRTGWGMWKVPNRKESDAEHCFSMMILGLELMSKNDLKLDQLKVVKMIAYHEFGEIGAGDITPFDNVSKEDKYNAEYKTIKQISEETDMPEMLSLWLEFEEGKTPEAIFVKKLDKYDAFLQAEVYDKEYNMPKMYEEFKAYSKQIIDEMQKLKR